MADFVSLPGSKRTPLSNSRLAGPVDRSEPATLTVRVRSIGDLEQLEKSVYEESARPLAERKYLTREQLAQRYGADPHDLDQIEEYAHEHDLVVVHRSAAERSVVLKGKLGDLLDAFPADVQIYHHAAGSYRGRRGEIRIPPHLSGVITGIFGFDTRPKRRAARNTASGGPGGQYGVPSTEFAARYQFPSEFGGVKLDGSGQTIGIIELGGGFRRSDLKVYFQEIGVPCPTVVPVSVDHSGNHPTTSDSADGEVMLDIEVAGAVVPKAKIVVYFAPNHGQGFLDAISAAIHDSQRQPTVISISWGGPEAASEQQAFDEFHKLFAEAAQLGVTICTASGDHGTADLDAQHWDEKIHVDHPSVDGLVLACGGTEIKGNKDVVWNDGTPFDVDVHGGGGWSSGGGISVIYPVPSYQQGAKLPTSIDTGKPGRGVPDIAMSATNYFLRVDTLEGASGGTSAVAPLMAALVARLNQAKRTNVGFLNPFLYANASKGIFTDVTQGTNAIKDTCKGYDAGPGWDACSGLGTPIGIAILKLL